jgi:hypothetical protein
MHLPCQAGLPKVVGRLQAINRFRQAESLRVLPVLHSHPMQIFKLSQSFRSFSSNLDNKKEKDEFVGYALVAAAKAGLVLGGAIIGVGEGAIIITTVEIAGEIITKPYRS